MNISLLMLPIILFCGTLVLIIVSMIITNGKRSDGDNNNMQAHEIQKQAMENHQRIIEEINRQEIQRITQESVNQIMHHTNHNQTPV